MTTETTTVDNPRPARTWYKRTAYSALALGAMSATMLTGVTSASAEGPITIQCAGGRISDSYGEVNPIVRCADSRSGTVKDTKADGYCVYYYVNWRLSDGSTRVNVSAAACPQGDTEGFYITRPAGAVIIGEGLGHYRA